MRSRTGSSRPPLPLALLAPTAKAPAAACLRCLLRAPPTGPALSAASSAQRGWTGHGDLAAVREAVAEEEERLKKERAAAARAAKAEAKKAGAAAKTPAGGGDGAGRKRAAPGSANAAAATKKARGAGGAKKAEGARAKKQQPKGGNACKIDVRLVAAAHGLCAGAGAGAACSGAEQQRGRCGCRCEANTRPALFAPMQGLAERVAAKAAASVGALLTQSGSGTASGAAARRQSTAAAGADRAAGAAAAAAAAQLALDQVCALRSGGAPVGTVIRVMLWARAAAGRGRSVAFSSRHWQVIQPGLHC